MAEVSDHEYMLAAPWYGTEASMQHKTYTWHLEPSYQGWALVERGAAKACVNRREVQGPDWQFLTRLR